MEVASFMGKCILACAVMFFGVLLGMQQANNGMIEMKGYQDPDLKAALSISEGDAKEASVLGHQIDLEEKQKSWNSWKLSTSFPRPAAPWPIRSQTQPVHCMTG